VRDAEVVTEAAESALRLLAEGRGHVLLVAPAGFGKSTTLRHLERSGRTLGLRTQRYPVATGSDAPDVVLVDDAHLLPAQDLAVLGNSLASTPRVVAAVEPPVGDGSFGEVLDRLAGSGTVVALEPWTADEVATLLEPTGEDRDPVDEAADVVSATGGLPWLVTELLADEDPVPGLPRPGHPTRPERQVLRALDRLPKQVNEVVLALCAGYAVDRGPLPPPLAPLAGPQLHSLLDRVYDAGILSRDGQVPPLVRRAVLHHAPRHRIRPYLLAVVDDLAGAGVDLGPLAEDLVNAGLRDPRLVVALVARADGLLSDDPNTSARLYATAVEGGGEPAVLSVRRAEALALAGDLDAARTALTGVSTRDEDPAPVGVRVAATVAVLSGQLQQAAALCGWAAQRDLSHDPDAPGVAAYVLFGNGDAVLASEVLDASVGRAPGLTESAVRALATAVRDSLGTDPATALSPLVQSALALRTDRRELQPDRPDTLAALLALHAGDLAWPSRSSRGMPSPATRQLSRAAPRSGPGRACRPGNMRTPRPSSTPSTRDPRGNSRGHGRCGWGWPGGQDDVRALTRLWADARGVLVGHPVDLYSLLPLGEIGLAAARMHEPELAEPVWNRALELLDRLGNPSLWGPAFHWYGIQAAILTNRPHAMTPHASALLAAARTSPFAAALARAGRSWVAVLGGDVDAPAVEAAARGLAAVGQRWEGARLAGPRRGSRVRPQDDGVVDGVGPRPADPDFGCRDEEHAAVTGRGQGGHRPPKPPRAGGRRAGPRRHDVSPDRRVPLPVGQDRRAPHGADQAAQRSLDPLPAAGTALGQRVVAERRPPADATGAMSRSSTRGSLGVMTR
jgi:hypothetical protein